MGKKSKKGVSRAGVKKHPGAGQSKARASSSSNNNSKSGGIVSNGPTTSAATTTSHSSIYNNKVMTESIIMPTIGQQQPSPPPPLDVLNMILMQQQQELQQQQQQQQPAVTMPGKESPCNKENVTATTSSTSPTSATVSFEDKIESDAGVVGLSLTENPSTMETLAVPKLTVGVGHEGTNGNDGSETLTNKPVVQADDDVVVVSQEKGEETLAITEEKVEETSSPKPMSSKPTAAEESPKASTNDEVLTEIATSTSRTTVDVDMSATTAVKISLADVAPLTEIQNAVTSDSVLKPVSKSDGTATTGEKEKVDSTNDADLTESFVPESSVPVMNAPESVIVTEQAAEDLAVAATVDDAASNPDGGDKTEDSDRLPLKEDAVDTTLVGDENNGSPVVADLEVTKTLEHATEASAVNGKSNGAFNATQQIKESEETKVDVWSTSIREIVAKDNTGTTQQHNKNDDDLPILDVTPRKEPPRGAPSMLVNTAASSCDCTGGGGTLLPASLDQPSPKECDTIKNDCGCIII